MKLKLKEDPKEWRKSALMSALGFAVMSSVLRWRHILPAASWASILCLLALVAMAALIQPKLFRGFYRFSSRMGFAISRAAGYAVLGLFFFVVITPLGLIMRMLGKDPLRLRRPAQTESYWSEVRHKSSLDRLF